MKLLKKLILTHAARLRHRSQYQKAPSRFLRGDVPYFSQWESRELNAKIIAKQMNASDDPNWKRSGAKNKKEYTSWSWSACGMACTKMLLAYRSGKTVPIVELGKRCAHYGGYRLPLEQSHGLIYKPYLSFIDKELGWKGKVITNTPQSRLVSELAAGNYLIASVSPLIRDPKSQPKTKGGHLILLLGYDKAKSEFYFHNPSGTSKKTQEYAAISFRDFDRFFSGRGILIQG